MITRENLKEAEKLNNSLFLWPFFSLTGITVGTAFLILALSYSTDHLVTTILISSGIIVFVLVASMLLITYRRKFLKLFNKMNDLEAKIKLISKSNNAKKENELILQKEYFRAIVKLRSRHFFIFCVIAIVIVILCAMLIISDLKWPLDLDKEIKSAILAVTSFVSYVSVVAYLVSTYNEFYEICAEYFLFS